MSQQAELIDVRSEQIRIIFSAVPSSLVAVLAVSTVLSVVLWEIIDHAVIVGWFATTNLLSAHRYYLYHRFQRLEKGPLVDYAWQRRVIATSLASGLTWGAGGYLLFAEQSQAHQVFLAVAIAGMSAGAITTLSALLPAARGFVLLTVTPIVVKFVLVNSEFSLAITLMSILFVVMILVSAQRLNQTIVDSLEVRYQRELAEQTIRRQAEFDELTDLPNRRLLLSNLRQEIAKAQRHDRYGAVFFIDLDRFKAINDSLGHAVGDDLLVRVAQKISARLREEDTVGRLGGDEFVVLLPEVGRDEKAAGDHASRIANEIRELFIEPFIIQDHEIHMTISIGIALFPANVSAEDLLKYADVAMYRAKSEGRDKVRLFSVEMQEAVNQQRRIEAGLRQALARDEFQLYFQAQYDADRHVVGAECLLRWNHPVDGLISPDRFIDIAEHTGLILPIGEWVMRSACEHLVWLDDLVLAVNVSPRQFADPRFVDKLMQILEETGAEPQRLKFEITESLAMANTQHTIETMVRLRELGIIFSVDDFGTGYSSLNYLHRLPVDELKIDQSFVSNISSVSSNAVIVDTIILMAQQLDLKVVAEGIETRAELDYLLDRDCGTFQGFFFSRPVPIDQFPG
ncbi:MAG TPA: EAL domain-containing protein [Gammaproteobacteria bacterium]|nr:EAL domain-containing protein [Gammaproteobacteria bacterium]